MSSFRIGSFAILAMLIGCGSSSEPSSGQQSSALGQGSATGAAGGSTDPSGSAVAGTGSTGPGQVVSTGDCSPSECGPAPLSNPYCPDGTSTGASCVRDAAGVCGWQFAGCPTPPPSPPPPPPPPAACGKSECGPAPGLPNLVCPDGTIAGPVCERAASGACGWHIIECKPVPPSACDVSACGPAPMSNPYCPNGGGGYECLASGGECRWTQVPCN